MCHRLCVTFSLKELQAIIQLKHLNSTVGPNYVELGTKLKPNQTYNASFNSPCPILLSEKHIFDGMPSNSVVLSIMQWGLSPSWEVEGKAQLKYRLTHAKKESLTRTKTFETLLKKGRRCVLVCEGFYQFVNLVNKLGKQVYYLHLKNFVDSRIERDVVRPCYIAAIFDTLQQSDGRDLYSFTIITVETPNSLSKKLNSRMPAIFNSTEQMLAWLDFVQVKFDDALDLLQNHIDHLEIDPVSNYVFKKSNIGPECIAVLAEDQLKEKLSSTSGILFDDDIDMKSMEEHLENVEREHEKDISNFIDHPESQKNLSTASTVRRADLLFDQTTVKSTLEELSNRMMNLHRNVLGTKNSSS